MQLPINYGSLRPGLIISYRVSYKHVPARSDVLWYGKIVDVSRSYTNPGVGFCFVKVLDEKLDGMTEVVFFDQIVGVFT
jgi:hypothetical protein